MNNFETKCGSTWSESLRLSANFKSIINFFSTRLLFFHFIVFIISRHFHSFSLQLTATSIRWTSTGISGNLKSESTKQSPRFSGSEPRLTKLFRPIDRIAFGLKSPILWAERRSSIDPFRSTLMMWYCDGCWVELDPTFSYFKPKNWCSFT